ncbi:hypothetical protein SLE2022_028190 [Rubroshorea leprosula]
MEDCESPSSRSQVSRMVESENPYRLLYCSSKCDKVGVIQELKKGVEPSLADYDRRTALHLAACEGCTEVFLLLLEKGADVNSLDRWGRTPLSEARRFGHEEICKILEARGGTDPEFIYLWDLTPKLLAMKLNAVKCSWKKQNLLEKGAYGEIYLVKWRGTKLAAKTIRSSIASNPRVKTTFLKELGLWQRLHHPNIVQFIGVLKHCDHLTECLRNGSLYDILKRKGRLDQPTAVAYALDIVRGMNYLHEHKLHAIIHQDLTPGNVLPDESGHLKVTDFGLSKIAQEKDSRGYKMTGGTGSYHYMAPEVYLHEMFQGPSNSAETAEQIADKRAHEDSRPPLSSYLIPPQITMLLRECWHKNPDCRPTFEEII